MHLINVENNENREAEGNNNKETKPDAEIVSEKEIQELR